MWRFFISGYQEKLPVEGSLYLFAELYKSCHSKYCKVYLSQKIFFPKSNKLLFTVFTMQIEEKSSDNKSTADDVTDCNRQKINDEEITPVQRSNLTAGDTV